MLRNTKLVPRDVNKKKDKGMPDPQIRYFFYSRLPANFEKTHCTLLLSLVAPSKKLSGIS